LNFSDGQEITLLIDLVADGWDMPPVLCEVDSSCHTWN